MLSQELRDRLERARTEPMDHWIKSDDPLVIKVENEQSGNVHTVIPDAFDCSCPDQTYRGPVDKHMLYLLEQDDNAGVAMRNAMQSHQQDLKEQYEELRKEQAEINSEIGDIRELQDLIDTVEENRDESMQQMTDELIQDHS